MTLLIRPATPADLPAIEAVMRTSMAALGATFYDQHQTASAVRYIAVADPQLVADGTYFVIEDEDQIVACGGWSKRKKLFTGEPPVILSEAKDLPRLDADRTAGGDPSPSSRLLVTPEVSSTSMRLAKVVQRSSGLANQRNRPCRLRMTDLLDPATEPARIRAMFVLPSHARRGIGRMIIDRAEAEAREAGFAVCELMATLPGVPLYRACGYEPLETVEIELPDGVRLECLRMSRCVK